MIFLKPGSDGRKECLSRRDVNSFSPLVAAALFCAVAASMTYMFSSIIVSFI